MLSRACCCRNRHWLHLDFAEKFRAQGLDRRYDPFYSKLMHPDHNILSIALTKPISDTARDHRQTCRSDWNECQFLRVFLLIHMHHCHANSDWTDLDQELEHFREDEHFRSSFCNDDNHFRSRSGHLCLDKYKFRDSDYCIAIFIRGTANTPV